jgi:hypothetical protein
MKLYTLQPLNSKDDPMQLMTVAQYTNMSIPDLVVGRILQVNTIGDAVSITIDTSWGAAEKLDHDQTQPVFNAELSAIARIQEILQPLSVNQLTRILRYLLDLEEKP